MLMKVRKIALNATQAVKSALMNQKNVLFVKKDSALHGAAAFQTVNQAPTLILS